jgi:hypothetical protein
MREQFTALCIGKHEGFSLRVRAISERPAERTGDIVVLPLAGRDGCRELGLAIHAEGGPEGGQISIEVQVHRRCRLHATRLGDRLVVRQIHQQHIALSGEGVGVLRDEHRTTQQSAVGRDLNTTDRFKPLGR